jgi:hypothetical protein
MAPKFKDMLLVVLEQGETAEATLGAVKGTINNIAKTAVILSLHTGFWYRNA